jgi:hypothetical protein
VFTTDNLKISSEIKVSILNELNQFSIMLNEKIIETIIRLNIFNHFEKGQRIKTIWGDFVLGRMTSF